MLKAKLTELKTILSRRSDAERGQTEGNKPQSQNVLLAALRDACLVKGLSSGVSGFGMGLMVSPVTFLLNQQSMDIRSANRLQGLPPHMYATAKNFARMGFINSSVDCFFRQIRSITGDATPLYAGCVTGALMEIKDGPKAMFSSCVSSAVFSMVMSRLSLGMEERRGESANAVTDMKDTPTAADDIHTTVKTIVEDKIHGPTMRF